MKAGGELPLPTPNSQLPTSAFAEGSGGSKFFAILVIVVLTGCRQSTPPPSSASRTSSPGRDASQPQKTQPEPQKNDPSGGEHAEKDDDNSSDEGAFGSLFESLGRGKPGPKIPAGLVPGGDCPAAGPGAAEEIAAQAAARVPLKVGLTLADTWKPTAQEEYECLTQISKIDDAGIEFTMSCDKPGTEDGYLRRVCREDLRKADMLHTQVGGIEVIDASGEEAAETVVGATQFSLSTREFLDLKRNGTTRHHYVQIVSDDRLAIEATGELRLRGSETANVIVNNAPVELPVLRAEGPADMWRFTKKQKGWVTALVLDDERFPLLVDYTHSETAGGTPDFRLHFPKISYPGIAATGSGTLLPGSGGPGGGGGAGAGGASDGAISEMERQLVEKKRVDVYGIYFDFNSDRIRKESEPILKEIAEMLGRNAAWTLSIDGHTDNVGGDAYNLRLSQRRSEAVRKALTERYAIAADRLTTAGHGAGAPKDTNETPEGRAKNRRVELIRRE
jgi:outer membrane protein OmpA-like peptidoglycan-associated protein